MKKSVNRNIKPAPKHWAELLSDNKILVSKIEALKLLKEQEIKLNEELRLVKIQITKKDNRLFTEARMYWDFSEIEQAKDECENYS